MGKIAAAAVTAALFGTVVRRGSPELALLLTVTAGVWILTAVLDGLGAAAAMAERLAQLAQMDAAVAGPVLKTVVVALVTRITAEICRGAGEGGLAAFVETAGTILALTAALPLMAAVLTMLEELLW
ncbi:MAG: stage III sporulation AC/AD family protein [Clostridiales bacterium]|nr:stage III sporulation AC/AD family protein [Clostridiales bacterium]